MILSFKLPYIFKQIYELFYQINFLNTKHVFTIYFTFIYKSLILKIFFKKKNINIYIKI